MNLQFSFSALSTTLPIALYGILGGLVVMAVICLAVSLLYRIGNRSAKGAEK